MSLRVLAIRLQATGDVVITLPYLNSLARRHPEAEIDLLTREETVAIPESLRLFSRVFALRGGRSFKRQCVAALVLLPRLQLRRYHAVLDLQNNEISRFVSAALRPKLRSRFDKESPLPAGERTRRAIEASGLGPVTIDSRIALAAPERAEDLLAKYGFPPDHRLVVLNPAGAFPSRNWPMDAWVAFAKHWQRLDSRPASFLLLGLDGMKAKARHLREHLGSRVLDLVGKTTPDEAFSLVRRADLVLSEDSGLMHMAWVLGVPTVALFGSSRGDWSRPLGPLSLCLDSADLECRFCMEPECRFGDVRCLTRRDPKDVASRAIRLLAGAGASA